MIYPMTITASAMRDINRSAILEIIRRESPISRTTIAERLEISLPTVVRIVDQLVDEGFVRLQGDSEWSGGRRRPLLEFNREGSLVLGVDLGGSKMYGAISDLGGNVIDEINLSQHNATDEENFSLLVQLIDTLLASPRLQGRPVRGIGVGVPGVTLHEEGVVQWSYQLNWSNFPLKKRLAEKYSLPITVDNDVNLGALGELWFGAGQNARNMVLVTIGVGIGAGIIVDRALYRGSNEASGEIGNLIPDKKFFGQDYKKFGALESVAAGNAIVARAQECLKARRDPAGLESLVAEDVFDAARQGQKWAEKIISEAIDYLAIAITNLSVTFDPDLIILGGGLANSTDLLITPILERIDGAVPKLPRLVGSNLGLRATVMGAITNVLHNTSNFYVVHKLS